MSAKQMSTPDRSTAAAFPRYLTGEVVADSVALQWPGLYARRWRPRYPNATLTPGATNPEVTQENIHDTICVKGWTDTVRPPSSYTNKLKTTQLAFPVDVCETIYSTASGYSASVSNLSQVSFATDLVFADGTTTEMSTVTGSVADGYTVSLQVAISV